MSMSPHEHRSVPRSERQHNGRRGWSRGGMIEASAVAVAAVVAVAGLELLSPSPSRSAALRASSTATPAVSDQRVARLAVTEGGVRFSFRVPRSWERFRSIPTDKSPGGPISINKSVVGPQGAEAIIYWTSFPDGDYADPCSRLLSPKIGRSAAALATAVSRARGTRLVTGSSNVTLGGRPGKHVVLTVRKDVGCDPGFFYSWRDVFGGALWPTTGVGDTIRVWIVDVDGMRIFIAAETTTDAGSALNREVRQIVQSVRFD
jgi:hypothetical protein